MFHFPFRQLLERYFFSPNFQQLKYEKKSEKRILLFLCFLFAILILLYMSWDLTNRFFKRS